jgi:hypothetical protein
MRLIAAVVLAVTLLAGPAALPSAGDEVPSCVLIRKHDVSDAKARRKCDAPRSAQVQHFQKRNRWVIFVT